jgi:hypothetical protein
VGDENVMGRKGVTIAGEHFQRRGDVANTGVFVNGALDDTEAPVPKTTKPHPLFSLKDCNIT